MTKHSAPATKAPKRCSYPGCNRRLYHRNLSGLCCDHVRYTGFVVTPMPPPEPDRALKTVHVTFATSCSSVVLRAPITLPRAPWEAPE